MRSRSLLYCVITIFATACNVRSGSCPKPANSIQQTTHPMRNISSPTTMPIVENTLKDVRHTNEHIPATLVEEIVQKLRSGNENPDDHERIERGVKQVAALWNTTTDGSSEAFAEFCSSHFVSDGPARFALYERLAHALEVLRGHSARMRLELSRRVQLDMGEILPLDRWLAEYEPSAHMFDDLFANKVAFVTILNFPNYSLQEKKTLSAKWNRKQWAYARLGDVFTARVPARVRQEIETAFTQADDYISNYNIHMGKVITPDKKQLFPADAKFITHWNLRDEIKSRYADKENGLAAQRVIFAIMKRIVDQSIPIEVIDRNEFTWEPVSNQLIDTNGKGIVGTPEKGRRYAVLLRNFQTVRTEDAYSPRHSTYIQRVFDRDLEYTEDEIEKLFVEVVSSPLTSKVGRLIEKRLGRKLEPFDIWYDGFKARAQLAQDQLSLTTRKRYSSPQDFHKDILRILKQLGFPPQMAEFIQKHIVVDPSRGAGHAWGALMRSDVSHLRTRVGKLGMDYKGYNIAIHELGHNVEQTLTLQNVDEYLLTGVPNTAFTEAWAFIFQHRDLELLGIPVTNPAASHLDALDNFWSSYEIMGVALVDMRVWRWLYAHPNANVAQLQDAVLTIAKDVWNAYYAPVFGVKDEILLAIYSHMIDYPLYLPAYPIGHVAESQIESFLQSRVLGREMIRICSQGRLLPDVWMQGAVGAPLSVKPMLEATRQALTAIR